MLNDIMIYDSDGGICHLVSFIVWTLSIMQCLKWRVKHSVLGTGSVSALRQKGKGNTYSVGMIGKSLWGQEVESGFSCWLQVSRCFPCSCPQGQGPVLSLRLCASMFIVKLEWQIKCKAWMTINTECCSVHVLGWNYIQVQKLVKV